MLYRVDYEAVQCDSSERKWTDAGRQCKWKGEGKRLNGNLVLAQSETTCDRVLAAHCDVSR